MNVFVVQTARKAPWTFERDFLSGGIVCKDDKNQTSDVVSLNATITSTTPSDLANKTGTHDLESDSVRYTFLLI